MTTPAEAVAVLNRINQADPSVLPALIAARVPCNRALADDPTVQVGTAGGRHAKDDAPEFEVGILGVLNGIFGIAQSGHGGPIGANYDADWNLTEFVVMP